MIKITKGGHLYKNGVFSETNDTSGFRKTITYKILSKHLKNDILDTDSLLKIKFVEVITICILIILRDQVLICLRE